MNYYCQDDISFTQILGTEMRKNLIGDPFNAAKLYILNPDYKLFLIDRMIK